LEISGTGSGTGRMLCRQDQHNVKFADCIIRPNDYSMLFYAVDLMIIFIHRNDIRRRRVVLAVFTTKLHGISPTTVCQSPKFLVAGISCDLPDVINCQFREFAAALLYPCIFCRQTYSLEFTAWSFTRSSCWLRTI